jgi:hypothetical protein
MVAVAGVLEDVHLAVDVAIRGGDALIGLLIRSNAFRASPTQ